MRRYEQTSGTIFTLVALVQLVRVLLRLPAQVGTFTVPIWFSVVAFLVTAGMAAWAFRTSRGTA